MPTPILGLMGTGDFTTNQRPKNWREMILHLFPNGMSPLTGILSKLASEKTDDPEPSWFQKGFPDMGGALSNDGIYIDSGLNTAYVYATHQATYGVQDALVFANVTEAIAGEFRKGHMALLRDTTDEGVDTLARVVGVTKNGASSVIHLKLMEADDNGATAANNNLATVDRILNVTNTNPEGGAVPDAIGYQPDELYNYCQIIKTPLSITETARLTRLRTEDALKEAKRECLMLHGMQIERALIYGERREWVGDNGEKERSMRGILRWIASDSDAVTANYRTTTETDYSGKTWLAAGEHWLDTKLEEIIRWNDAKELLAIGGSGALLGVNRLAKFTGQVNLEPTTVEYGLKVTRWHTAFGTTINIITHPLFSFDPIDRHRMIIFDPKRLKWRPLRDTMYQADAKKSNESGNRAVDAINEQYLTEASLELHHARSFGQLDGVGKDNAN